jgi:hypothetical protein
LVWRVFTKRPALVCASIVSHTRGRSRPERVEGSGRGCLWAALYPPPGSFDSALRALLRMTDGGMRVARSVGMTEEGAARLPRTSTYGRTRRGLRAYKDAIGKSLVHRSSAAEGMEELHHRAIRHAILGLDGWQSTQRYAPGQVPYGITFPIGATQRGKPGIS